MGKSTIEGVKGVIAMFGEADVLCRLCLKVLELCRRVRRNECHWGGCGCGGLEEGAEAREQRQTEQGRGRGCAMKRWGGRLEAEAVKEPGKLYISKFKSNLIYLASRLVTTGHANLKGRLVIPENSMDGSGHVIVIDWGRY